MSKFYSIPSSLGASAPDPTMFIQPPKLMDLPEPTFTARTLLFDSLPMLIMNPQQWGRLKGLAELKPEPELFHGMLDVLPDGRFVRND